MAIKSGTTDVAVIRRGVAHVIEVRLGGQLVWSAPALIFYAIRNSQYLGQVV